MELRTACSPRDVRTYDTERLRSEFLIDDLFQKDYVKMVYSHIDRIITGVSWNAVSWASSISAVRARSPWTAPSTHCVRATVCMSGEGAGKFPLPPRIRHVLHTFISIPARHIPLILRCTSVPRTVCIRNSAARRMPIPAPSGSISFPVRSSPASW